MTFNTQWFMSHQRRLLLLLNHRWTRRWFRWVLCIRPDDVGHRRPIVALFPHAYVVLNETGAALTADIRSYDKFARRLYFAFRPMWWTLHAWDWLVADRWQPRWSFGFDTLTAYGLGGEKYGLLSRQVQNQTWSQAHDGAGNTLYGVGSVSEYVAALFSGATSGWLAIQRFIVSFDTSLLGSGATISSGQVMLFGAGDAYDGLGIAPTIDIFRASVSDPNLLTLADFGECGDESQSSSGPKSVASWSPDDYNVFDLNALGLANINVTDLTPWFFREATYDAPDVEPLGFPAGNASGFGACMPDAPGTTLDPKIQITYTPSISSYATQVDIFNNVGESLWTKSTRARWIDIQLLAGGGGGGSGRKGADGSVRNGGGGGGAGTHCLLRLPASALGDTVAVMVGAGGAGGASQTVNSTDGVVGADGEDTTFGTLAIAKGGRGGDGGNQTLTNGGNGLASFPVVAYFDEGDGGICADGGPGRSPANSVMRAGGGGGGGIDSLNAAAAGATGGTVGDAGAHSGYGGTIAGGVGGPSIGPGGAGGDGVDAPVNSGFGGSGGGGGGAGSNGDGGPGGAGGVPGGGGGGGGATYPSGNSGAGGAGGSGLAIIVTYF